MQDLVETEVHKYSFASLYQVNSATELSRHKITVWLVTATMRSARLKNCCAAQDRFSSNMISTINRFTKELFKPHLKVCYAQEVTCVRLPCVILKISSLLVMLRCKRIRSFQKYNVAMLQVINLSAFMKPSRFPEHGDSTAESGRKD